MYLNQESKLLILHSVLWNLSTTRVDLSDWRCSDTDCDDSQVKDSELLSDLTTTACGIGWATALPAFRALGFSFSLKTGPTYDDAGNVYIGWDAVQRFFDFDEWTAKVMFGGDHNIVEAIEAGEESLVEAIIGKRSKEQDMADIVKVMRRIRRFLQVEILIEDHQAKILKKGEKLIEVTNEG